MRARLCVDVYFVVHGFPFREVREVDLLLVELFAAESGELHVVQGPIELNVFPGADLFGCGLDDGGSKKINSCVGSVALFEVIGNSFDAHPTSSLFPFLS